jgi:hypothetical protein
MKKINEDRRSTGPLFEQITFRELGCYIRLASEIYEEPFNKLSSF